MDDGSIFVCTERSAINLAFQGFSKELGKVDKVAEMKGTDLVGARVSAPLSAYKFVHVLPMDSVLATKVTKMERWDDELGHGHRHLGSQRFSRRLHDVRGH